MPGTRKIIVVTPNISEQMGGEAITSFQFIRHLRQTANDVSVITHERNTAEVRQKFTDLDLHFIKDSYDQKIAWRISPHTDLVAMLFFLRARRVIRQLLKSDPDAVVHYLCPVSPIIPRFPLRGACNVLGPLTGNIYYPPAFQALQSREMRLKDRFHRIVQRLLSVTGDKAAFARILVSGGERTRNSMLWAGGRDETMVDVVFGVSSELGDHPVIAHQGENHRFMTSGRLVPHKGVDLTIEALIHTERPVTFDVYGGGEELERLRALSVSLGVADRVRFMGWVENHDELFERMADYRGYMVPSLAEANGIVVQEAMVAGLPVVCLKWGGPTMLADDSSAILVEPSSRDHVVRGLAAAMDRLAADAAFANDLVRNARQRSSRFVWSSAADEWIGAYPEPTRASTPTQPKMPSARV